MSSTLTVRRWSRFGADRLVVTQDNGASVGWIDLRSGEVVVESPDGEVVVRRAAQAYLRADVLELVLPQPRRALDAFDSFARPPAPAPPAIAVGPQDEGIAARLDRLVEKGWLALHDLPVGLQGGLLDHLLIGPGGVFTIRSYAHPGSVACLSRTGIVVNGRPTNYLRDAQLERARMEHLLGAAAGLVVEVRSVIVLDAVVFAPCARPDAALVVSRDDLPDIFRRLPLRLAATKVEAVRAAAGRRATWRG
ncbi:MAG: nuclease-related domain-containing protein [Cellulomonas sp.]